MLEVKIEALTIAIERLTAQLQGEPAIDLETPKLIKEEAGVISLEAMKGKLKEIEDKGFRYFGHLNVILHQLGVERVEDLTPEQREFILEKVIVIYYIYFRQLSMEEIRDNAKYEVHELKEKL